jgi:hypothetical protein
MKLLVSIQYLRKSIDCKGGKMIFGGTVESSRSLKRFDLLEKSI